MANFSTMSQSRRRPKRQRTPTTIYTDDNPATFTTKKKKGENNGRQDDDDDDFSPRPSADSSSLIALEDSMSMPPPDPVLKRGPGRPPRRKSVEQALSVPGGKTRASTSAHTTTKKTERPDSATSSSPPSLSTKNPTEQQSTQVVTKRKRGRPPKNRPKDLAVVTSESDQSDTKNSAKNHSDDSIENKPPTFTAMIDLKPVVDDTNDVETNGRRSETTSLEKTNDNGLNRPSVDSIIAKGEKSYGSGGNKVSFEATSTRSLIIERRSKPAKIPLMLRSRFSSSVSWTPPQRDIEGTYINHSVTVVPLLPPILIDDNDDNDSFIDTKEKLRTDEDSSHDASVSKMTILLKSKYPAVFDEGVPKTSSSIAPPFSSTSQISSANSLNSSKHKLNQPQNHLSQLPAWSPLYDPPVFFEDDYDRESGHLDISSTLPVTRHITAMTVRKPNHDYLILGDSVGFVTIYSLGKDNINIPIAQLESVACQQRGKAEQDRLRAALLKRREKGRGGSKSCNGGSKFSSTKFPSTAGHFSNTIGTQLGTLNQTNSNVGYRPQNVRSVLIDTSDTTIHALGMIENRVVLATSEELECMDVPSGTSLWVCPLSSNRFVTSLDMHLNTFDVLVSCSKTLHSTDTITAPISPLMLLQHSKNNVEICDANSPMLVRSPSCTAIWDIGARNRLLFIALSSNRQEHELVLVSGGSIDSWKVACKTKIPTKTSSATSGGAPTKLSQSPGGIYTLVASSRGIRLYQTESLQLIHVYGDQLALHGQSVVWKDCWLTGSYLSKYEKFTKAAKGLPPQWLQSDDLLGEKFKKASEKRKNSNIEDDFLEDENKTNLSPYLIGVPHTKGPKELCENLHVWKVEHPSVVPMMSIPLPRKAEGALGLVGSGNSSNSNNTPVTEDRIILVTKDGKGHFLSPKMESNFAGISYPPGFQVVTNNIEYIEDEDATDNVVKSECSEKMEDKDVDVLSHGNDDESMDEELREAMRRSLLEHKKHETAKDEDEFVDILDSDEEKCQQVLPCRPEPYLRQMINTSHEGEANSGSESEEEKREKSSFSTSIGSLRFNGKAGSELSTTEVLEPKVTSALFISKVLDLIPNMPKPKPLEEDCLSFTKSKVVVAVNPVLPVRPGRGRKSRAANLETMLKASINPYLQSLMLSRQGVPVNGQGSRLMARRKAAPQCTSVFPDAKAMELKSYPRNLSHAEESKLDPSNEMGNGESQLSRKPSATTLSMTHSINSRLTTNADEEAVVMGLLGLSPCHTTNVASNSFISLNSKDKDIGVDVANGRSKGSSFFDCSSPQLLGVKDEENQVLSALSSDQEIAVEGQEIMSDRIIEKEKRGNPFASCSACRGRHVIHSCGKRALPIDYEEIARKEKERKEKEEEEKKRIRTEKRRLADQKRREAKKQKQRELQEQRIREEKERLEDEKQRRLQEDFASHDLIRQRREHIVASYANHISTDNHERESKENTSTQNVERDNSIYLNDVGENITARSFHQRTAVFQVTPSFSQPPQPQKCTTVSTVDTQYIQRSIPQGEDRNTHETDRTLVPGMESGSSIAFKSNQHVDHSAPSQSPLAQAALSSVSAKLASADALVALANLALCTKTSPDTENQSADRASSSNEPEFSSYASYGNDALSNTGKPAMNQNNLPTYGASHGFGGNSNLNGSTNNEYSSEIRGIPSYATIRGQYNNRNNRDVETSMANKLTPGASFSNGFTHPTSESNVRSWASSPNDQD